jgi:transcriptional regulator
MYIPTKFREERPEVLASAIRRIQLAAMVTPRANGLQISHLPMVLKDKESWTLEAHVARPNPHWALAGTEVETAAIFQGPHAYVSPSWYASKREHGKVVPTWNYIAIHAHGRLEAIEDGEWLLAHLNDLTNANEAERPQPWELADAPADFVRSLTRAIVGLRLTITRIEASWKMAQHRSDADRAGVIHGLEIDPEG